MTPDNGSRRGTRDLGPLARSALAAYGLAAALALAALIVARLVESDAQEPIYAPLVAAVAVSIWYGGSGPGVLTLVIAWLLAPFFLYADGSFSFRDRDDLDRWSVALAVALVVVWVSLVMRRGQQRAATAAVVADESTRQMQTLQELASALSGASNATEVEHVLVQHAPPVIGAQGGGLGLVDGDDLVLAELTGLATQIGPAGIRLPLESRMLLCRAVADNELQLADDREQLVERFPDTAARLPAVQSALAVPLSVAGEVVGAMGFLFQEREAMHAEAESLASIIADLGGQALARARAYEKERELRRGLDRVLLAAPRLHSGAPDEIRKAICREAHEALGADFAAIWRVHDEHLELLSFDPDNTIMSPGLEANLEEFPHLLEAVERLEVTFVSDILEEAGGANLERSRRLGIRSSVRAPISVGGRAQLVLIVSWHKIITKPESSTIVFVRRLADQAGLALEQLERRQAEEEARRGARETRRLLDTTAVLSAAATPSEVRVAIVREGLRSLGATGAVVVARRGEQSALEVVETSGYEPEAIESWRTLPLDAPVPLAEAVRSGRVIAVETRRELEERFPEWVAASADEAAAWLVAPLSAAGSVIGAVGFSFPEPQQFSDADLEFVEAFARQCGQALDRALLLAAEHAARTRAEEMVVLASALSEATGVLDIIAAAGGQLHALLAPDLVGVYLVEEADATLELVETAGGSLEVPEDLRRLSLAQRSPPAEAVRRRESIWLDEEADWDGVPDAGSWRAGGARSLCAVPLAAAEAVAGVLVTAFASESALDLDTRRLIESVARQASQPLARAGLMEREHRARVAAESAAVRTRRLQSMTQALAIAPTPREVAAIVVSAAVAAVAGDAGAFIALDERREAPELLADVELGERGFPEELLSTVTEAAYAGVVLEMGTDAPSGRKERVLRDVLARDGYRSAVCVPLGVGPRVLGTLVVCSRSHDRLEGEDVELLLTVARVASQAFERSRLFDTEQTLRARSERIQALTAALSSSVSQRDVADVVVEAVAGAMRADASAFSVVLEDRKVQKKLAWYGYGDELQEPWLELPLDAPTPGNRAIKLRTAVFYETFDALGRDFPQTYERMRGTGHESFLFVPLVAGGKANGLVITSWRERVVLADEDRAFVESLARQAALALDRARQYESERTIAETLQRSMLPASLPKLDRIQLAARYLPGTAGVDIGGDWYDAIPLPNRRLAFVVGDVVGKGVQAAATMAQLRNALRAFAHDQMKPSSTVERLNRLTEELADPMFATVVYAVLDPESGVLRFTAAGHPPPLVVYPSGEAEYLEGGRGLPLGTGNLEAYDQRTVELPVGSTLVLYTDGLVERRGEAVDEGLERLRKTVQEGPAEPAALAEHVLARLVGDLERGDDIALLVVRLLAVAPEVLQLALPTNTRSLDLARDALRAWLAGAPVSQAEAHDIVLATWEACANAVEHPGSPKTETFRLTVELQNSTVRVSVGDSGRWLPEAERPDRGLGLLLIHSLMSSVDIGVTDEGTLVRLEKILASESVPASESA